MHCTIAFLALVPIDPRLVRHADRWMQSQPNAAPLPRGPDTAFDFFRIVKEQTAFATP
jgi:hypothetical protein